MKDFVIIYVGSVFLKKSKMYTMVFVNQAKLFLFLFAKVGSQVLKQSKYVLFGFGERCIA